MTCYLCHVHHQEVGLRYVYVPAVPRRAARKSALRHLVDTFFAGSSEQAAPVGGCIVQPTKIADRTPIYPAKQRDAAEPEFVNALIDAVNQWRFTQTRLDGVPVEVVIRVSARFVIE